MNRADVLAKVDALAAVQERVVKEGVRFRDSPEHAAASEELLAALNAWPVDIEKLSVRRTNEEIFQRPFNIDTLADVDDDLFPIGVLRVAMQLKALYIHDLPEFRQFTHRFIKALGC